MKTPTVWHITPCKTFKVNQYFGGTCHVHPQGGRISQLRIQHKIGLGIRHSDYLVTPVSRDFKTFLSESVEANEP
jgi:hypothetical protein